MIVLGIDTATSVASVALMDDEKLIGLMTLNDKKTHSQKLMVLIEDLFEQTGIDIQDVDKIAVAVGPGSFTGLRIGVTTAKALAHGANKPVVQVSALESLAAGIMHKNVCAMFDARRDTVFTGIYGHDKLSDSQLHIDELIEICHKIDEVCFVGDGAVKHREKLSEALGERAIFAPRHLNLSSAGALCELAMLVDENHTYDDVHVTYLRKSQAEREYEEKQK